MSRFRKIPKPISAIKYSILRVQFQEIFSVKEKAVHI